MTLAVACCLWQANDQSQPFSRCYDETWVEKLYRACRRNLTVPFEFVVFTDHMRSFDEGGIWQSRLARRPPNYGSLIEPFKLHEPTIIFGLDTVIVGNIDHMAEYCMTRTLVAQPRDPYKLERSINPVVLKPAGYTDVYEHWHGENDMDHLRRMCAFEPIDDLWPGQVLSLKAHRVRDTGLPPAARIVYFHGTPKPHEVAHLPWIREHWR